MNFRAQAIAYCGRATDGAIEADGVIPDGIECDHMAVGFQLLAVGVRQSREAAHVHAKRKIAALDVRGRNKRLVRVASDDGFLGAEEWGRAITDLRIIGMVAVKIR